MPSYKKQSKMEWFRRVMSSKEIPTNSNVDNNPLDNNPLGDNPLDRNPNPANGYPIVSLI